MWEHAASLQPMAVINSWTLQNYPLHNMDQRFMFVCNKGANLWAFSTGMPANHQNKKNVSVIA